MSNCGAAEAEYSVPFVRFVTLLQKFEKSCVSGSHETDGMSSAADTLTAEQIDALLMRHDQVCF